MNSTRFKQDFQDYHEPYQLTNKRIKYFCGDYGWKYGERDDYKLWETRQGDTVEAIRRRAKWENDEYICRGHILNEDALSKKFLVSNFNNYKMVDSRPVLKQFNELLRILGQYTQHDLKMDESISVSSVIYKLPPSWKDFKHNDVGRCVVYI
ncbi:hypothetical protein Tco_0434663 [Tanacetum coccineum]